MKEIEAILNLYKRAQANNLKMALATVISTTGSVYRRAGARMLITADASSAGTISGGCIEQDLIARAQDLCSLKSPKLLTYQTTKSDPYDFGSGCDGSISCFIEPLEPGEAINENRISFDEAKIALERELTANENIRSQANDKITVSPIVLLEEVYKKRIAVCSATVFSTPESMLSKLGARVIYFQNNFYKIDPAINNDSSLLNSIVIMSRLVFENGAFSQLIETNEGTYGVFFEKIEPPIKLLIFGAGDDSLSLAAIAHASGLSYSITDYRTGLLDCQRFPNAEQIIKCRAEEYQTNLVIDEFTACIIMHHHYDVDMAALEYVLSQTASFYIGVLGPRKRTMQLLIETSQDKPSNYTNIQQDRLFAPIGLDIGSETPEEIAIAIIAEIIAVWHKRNAPFLRQKNGPIHEVNDTMSLFDRTDSSGQDENSSDNLAAKLEQNSAVSNVQVQCHI